MNTGHDGSMGTLHANSPREALSRIESMITMGGYALPMKTIREMMTSSIDVIVQASRLRDGSRRITHITEVLGMEGDVVITQDLFVYELLRRGRAGKADRAASFDRDRAAEILGPRAHVWRRKPSGGGARHLGSPSAPRRERSEGVGMINPIAVAACLALAIRRSGVCLHRRRLASRQASRGRLENRREGECGGWR